MPTTTLIEEKKNGADFSKMTVGQRQFVNELLASNMFDATDAARKAGYKNPAQAATKLLKNKLVARALGKAQRERNERCRVEADDVLNYLSNVLYFNPLNYFRPSDDGEGWIVTDMNSLPEWVGRLIDGMEIKNRTLEDGTVEQVFKIKLVSKATALGLAMKHVGVEKHEVKHTFDWDQLLEETDTDPINAKIEEAKQAEE